MKSKVILTSKQQICEFLKIKKDHFYKLVHEGLPVKKRGGQWTGHVDELDEFFRLKSPSRFSFRA